MRHGIERYALVRSYNEAERFILRPESIVVGREALGSAELIVDDAAFLQPHFALKEKQGVIRSKSPFPKSLEHASDFKRTPPASRAESSPRSLSFLNQTRHCDRAREQSCPPEAKTDHPPEKASAGAPSGCDENLTIPRTAAKDEAATA